MPFREFIEVFLKALLHLRRRRTSCRESKAPGHRNRQRSQDHNRPFGLQAVALVRREVLDAVDLLDQLRAVDHLAMPLLLEDVQDVLRVLRAVRIEPLAIQELQGVEHGGRLLSAEC